jgi:hypothetical protein
MHKIQNRRYDMTNEKFREKLREGIREKIEEYINSKIYCVRLELETIHDAYYTTLAYLQALADADLITMNEYNFYLGTLTDRLYE